MDFGLLNPAWVHTPVASLTDDTAFTQALLDVEAAWVTTQAAFGLTDEAQAERITGSALVEDFDLPALAAATVSGGNALIPLLGQWRARLRAADPDAPVDALHRGATSQDIIDSALMLITSAALKAIEADLRRSLAAAAHLAEAHRDTLCVARSLTQHALPTTFGLRAANWLQGLLQGFDRLRRTELPLSWGGAAGTQAALSDRLGASEPGVETLAEALAERLGLDPAPGVWHVQRLPITAVAAMLGDLTAAAGTIAANVLNASRPEIGELTEPRAAGKGGSSAMPQKQNPVMSVLIKQAALSAPQQVAALYMAAGSAVDERPDGAWHSEWASLRELLRLAGGAIHHLADLLEGLSVNTEAMARNLHSSGDLLLSERLSARLAPLLDGGAAEFKDLVGQCLSQSGAAGSLRTLLRSRVDTSVLPDAEFEALFDPRNYLGQVPVLIDQQLTRYKESVA